MNHFLTAFSPWRRWRGWAVALLAGWLWLNPACAARLALVMGNKDYNVGALKNPLNDANAMAEALQNLGFKVTLVKNFRRDDIGSFTESFTRSIRPGDEVVVYYAGHGLQVKGVNYFPAVDASIRTETDVPLNSLSLNTLLAQLEESRAGVRLLLLDACRDNPYSRGFRSQSRGLAKVEDAPSGTLMHFATRPGGISDDGSGQNGLYTSHLLQHLGTPGLPVESMLKRVAAGVRKESGGSQQPWTEGALEGEFYFRMGGGGGNSLPMVQAPLVQGQLPQAPVIQPPVNNLQHGQVVKDCPDCPEMVVIGGGSFDMGSPATEVGRSSAEGPVRRVTVKGFLLGQYELTVAQYLACVGAGACREPEWREVGTGSNNHYKQLGAALTHPRNPVVGISWSDAQAYAAWLSRKTGKQYRLPSEAEWEYAARAGAPTRWSFGDEESQLGNYAWYSGNSGGRTHEVGSKKPNAWGLYDMHGNVWEWVQDAYQDSYQGAPEDGSAREGGSGVARVLRGGSWSDSPRHLRSADRDGYTPDDREIITGVRIARTY